MAEDTKKDKKVVELDPKTMRKHLMTSIMLMVTSALGPAFLTQTAAFTEQYQANLSFAILLSLVISLGAQLNIWRILSVSDRYAQDFANEVLPGLGSVIAFIIVLGGLAFNVGNVSGAGLGVNSVFNSIDFRLGGVIVALLAIVIFLVKNGTEKVDQIIKVLAVIMLIAAFYVAIVTQPPLGEVAARTVNPQDFGSLMVPMITLVGGTVGGYITFAGAHKLIDNRITGKENVKYSTLSSTSAIVGSGIMRYLLFFSFLGVVSTGVALDPSNPAASAFEIALGRPGEIIFGIILLSAGLSSVVGCAYTSSTFLKSYHPIFEKYQNTVIVLFIALSTLIFVFTGEPVTLLILAGALNGLILPLTLGATLAGAYNKKLVGDYKHPIWMTIFGVISVLFTLYIGISSLGGLAQLF